MSLQVQGVNQVVPAYKTSYAKPVGTVSFKAANDQVDTVEIKKEEKPELTVEDKQKIIKKSRENASGWAILGSVFSTAYYGLRSNNTIAKKYNLDPERDKDLIKQIKKEQTLWTLPGALLPLAGALAAYIIANNMNSKNIEIE